MTIALVSEGSPPEMFGGITQEVLTARYRFEVSVMRFFPILRGIEITGFLGHQGSSEDFRILNPGSTTTKHYA